jgi:preprotein translocase subunit YajC
MRQLLKMKTKLSISDRLLQAKSFTLVTCASIIGSISTFAAEAFAQDEPVKTAAAPAGAGGAGGAGASGYLNFLLLGGMFFFMWLFIIRPQAKRQKEHKQFLDKLANGQEVVTSGGLIGKITSVQDTVVTLDIGASSVRVLKSAISGELGRPQIAPQS